MAMMACSVRRLAATAGIAEIDSGIDSPKDTFDD